MAASARASDSLVTKIYEFEDAIALDVAMAFQNIYVLDRSQSRVYAFDSGGEIKKAIGGFGFGKYAFNDPADLSAANGIHVFVADAGNQRVVQYDRDLNYMTSLEAIPTISEQEPGFNLQNGFSRDKWRPLSLALSPDGELYILEETTRQIIRLNPANFPKSASAWKSLLRFGGYDAGMGALLAPTDINISDNRLIFVADPKQKSVLQFDQFGNFIDEINHADTIQPISVSFGYTGELQPGASSTTTRFLVVTSSKAILLYEISRSGATALYGEVNTGKLLKAVGAISGLQSVTFLRDAVLILTQKALYKMPFNQFRALFSVSKQ
jgi:hypothetical protein